ncbi:MAG: imidazole glycerol phosphate synthase subunit HisF [Synergistales bacterium]|nr:imidazole glycerol phosphate synthase subunit HisF [Synergistales bacterium]
MLTKRIIPCLDVKEGRVVKGRQFVGLRDAGDPAELAALYMAQGADEIVFLDISASGQQRKTEASWVNTVAGNLFIPFTVGGGITNLDEAVALVTLGADKISLNTAAVRRPALIQECARILGSQAVVVAVDARRTQDSWEVVVKGGTEETGIDVQDWVEQATRLGAGEILLTSMDRDGTNMGYDLALLRSVADRVRVPLIASGGAGTAQSIADALAAGADAALAASIFHFAETTVDRVKEHLTAQGIPVRTLKKGEQDE